MDDISVFVGRIHYKAAEGGWSENYILKANTAAAAKTGLTAILNARKAMLPDTITLRFASVSKLGRQRNSFKLTGTPALGSDTVGTYTENDPEDTILVRQETADGQWANRHVHIVPDDAVSEGVYDPTAVAAWHTLLTTYTTALTTNTGYLLKTGPVGSETFTVVDWAAATVEGKSSHPIGRPFGQRRGRRPVGL